MRRTAAGLREVLFEQIEGIRNRSVDVTEAKAVAVVAGVILKSVEVEMPFREQQRQLADSGQEIGDLELSNLPTPDPAAPKPAALTGPRIIRGRAQSGSP